MATVAVLVAMACKSVVKAFFSLPSLEFVTASSSITPDTPVGSILTEQITVPAMTALDMAAAVSSDLLTLALLAPIIAGMMLCALRATSEFDLNLTSSRRGLSSYCAGGLGYFFASAHNYRRALALATSAVLRAVFWFALVLLPLWAVSEAGGMLAFAAAYIPAGFPLLPAAIALSLFFLLLGFFMRTRRYLVSPIYIENPELTLRESARRSAKLMHGHRMAAASLELGYIAWWLLGFFTLGIVLALFVLPYYLCCRAIFYRRIVDLQLQKEEA